MMDHIHSLDPRWEIPSHVFYISVAFLSSLSKSIASHWFHWSREDLTSAEQGRRIICWPIFDYCKELIAPN